MRRIIICLSLLALIASSPVLFADETFFLRGQPKPLKGVIEDESSMGILVFPSKKTLSPGDIVDVEYEIKPLTVRLSIYRKALEKEQESTAEGVKDAVRRVNLNEAIKKYEQTLQTMAREGQSSAIRHLQYRIAYLRAREALEFGAPPGPALKALDDFRKLYPDSWQLTPCLLTEAKIHLQQKNYKEAEKTFEALSNGKVPADVKQDAEFAAAEVWVKAGQHNLAMKRLKVLEKKLPKGGPQALRVQIAQAECLASGKQTAEANKILRGILNDTKDNDLKAMAYNTLGKNLFDQGLLKEARWEFLWVDVVYNQSPGEHAKALYYLSEIFGKLNDPDRAQECRQMLLTSPQFSGLEFQRRAQQSN